MAFVKIAQAEIKPLFMCAIRSGVASLCLLLWIRAKKQRIFPSWAFVFHGAAVGLLFAGEFAALYVSVKHTPVSNAYVLLYTAPFFAALGAHWFLTDDRLTLNKIVALITAFIGVNFLFSAHLRGITRSSLWGDILALSAGAMWGFTSVYVKKYLVGKVPAILTLFYQLAFSTLFLFIFSFLWEKDFVTGLSGITLFSLFYQTIIIAFLSYLVWFEMIDRYPISILHLFSFFTPVFGVIISGLFILKEVIRFNTVFALILVSIALIIANRPTIHCSR